MNQLSFFKRLSEHPVSDWFAKHRFGVLGLSTLLFFIAPSPFENFLDPWLMQSIYIFIITTASINLMQTKRKKTLFAILAGLSGIILITPRIFGGENRLYEIFIFTSFTIYFFVIIYNLFKQMRRIEVVDEEIIIGSITGYLLLGTMGFLIFCDIEMLFPGSFSNTSEILKKFPNDDTLFEMTRMSPDLLNDLYYFAFVSFTTVGYGDITPVSQVAKKMVVILSIIGPFYMAIVVASLVGKFMSYKK